MPTIAPQTEQKFLQDLVKRLFIDYEVITNARKVAKVMHAESGNFLEIGIFCSSVKHM